MATASARLGAMDALLASGNCVPQDLINQVAAGLVDLAARRDRHVGSTVSR
jgi:hypothetical protein